MKSYQFEIPYNFDPMLIELLAMFDPMGTMYNCIYVCPYPQDYAATPRNDMFVNNIDKMSRIEYVQQMEMINQRFPGKLQLLLQNPNKLMDEKYLNFYHKIGFNKFCVNSFEQASLIKSLFPTAEVIGSITLHADKAMLDAHPEFKKVFSGFVLDFRFCRELETIKQLPKDYRYVLLTNAYCNCNCDGTHHWFKEPGKENYCPGLMWDTGWDKSTRIRPMDLHIFEPYISVFKLQDRGWPTQDIIRDVILYTTDFSLYPGIEYDEKIYNTRGYQDAEK